MEVIQLDNLIVRRFVNPFKKSNSFLLEIAGTKNAWLFDIGDSESLLSTISSYEIKGLFLTHSHFDHIFNIKRLQDEHPECVIFGSQKCIEWLNDDRRNLSFYYENPLNFKPSKYTIVLDGDIIELADRITVRAYHTPGHTEDCMTYNWGNFLITGDSYIPNVPPVTKLKGGNKEQYEQSLNLIKSLINKDTILLPGHGSIYNFI